MLPKAERLKKSTMQNVARDIVILRDRFRQYTKLGICQRAKIEVYSNLQDVLVVDFLHRSERHVRVAVRIGGSIPPPDDNGAFRAAEDAKLWLTGPALS